MNYETIEFLTDQYCRLFDYYFDGEVEAVKILDEWTPSSFCLTPLIITLVISGNGDDFMDHVVVDKMVKAFYVEDGLEDVSESLIFMVDNSLDELSKIFWIHLYESMNK